MANIYKVVQNDNNIKFTFTVTKDGYVESLLGAVVTIQFINSATGYAMTRQCTITDAQSAECVYVLRSEDLTVTGNYKTEITVVYANGTKITSQNVFLLAIMPEFAIG